MSRLRKSGAKTEEQQGAHKDPLPSALMRDIAAPAGSGSPPEAEAAPQVFTFSAGAATAANPVTVTLLP